MILEDCGLVEETIVEVFILMISANKFYIHPVVEIVIERQLTALLCTLLVFL